VAQGQNMKAHARFPGFPRFQELMGNQCRRKDGMQKKRLWLGLKL